MLLMIIEPATPGGPWDFLLKWLPTLGWPIVILIVWRMSRFVTKAEERTKGAEKTLLEVKSIVNDGNETIGKVKELVDASNECLAGQGDIARKLMDRVEKVQQVIESRQAVTHTPNPIVIDRGVEEAVAKGLSDLTELIRHQSEIHTEEFEIMRQLAKDQAVISTNQTNITAGFQRVVEQLISIVNQKG